MAKQKQRKQDARGERTMASQQTETITGVIGYTPVRTAVLREGGNAGRTSLLVIDAAPFGLYDAQDIAAAFDLFHDRLAVPSGQQVRLLGIRDSVSGHPIIAVVRAEPTNVLFGGGL